MFNSPPSFAAKSGAEGFSSSTSKSTFQSGAFNVGSGDPMNLAIMAGAAVLLYLIFKKK